MSRLGAPLVAFREISCSWRWGAVKETQGLFRPLLALPHPQRGVGAWVDLSERP